MVLNKIAAGVGYAVIAVVGGTYVAAKLGLLPAD